MTRGRCALTIPSFPKLAADTDDNGAGSGGESDEDELDEDYLDDGVMQVRDLPISPCSSKPFSDETRRGCFDDGVVQESTAGPIQTWVAFWSIPMVK